MACLHILLLKSERSKTQLAQDNGCAVKLLKSNAFKPVIIESNEPTNLKVKRSLLQSVKAEIENDMSP
jgi:hypothetical protein